MFKMVTGYQGAGDRGQGAGSREQGTGLIVLLTH